MVSTLRAAQGGRAHLRHRPVDRKHRARLGASETCLLLSWHMLRPAAAQVPLHDLRSLRAISSCPRSHVAFVGTGSGPGRAALQRRARAGDGGGHGGGLHRHSWHLRSLPAAPDRRQTGEGAANCRGLLGARPPARPAPVSALPDPPPAGRPLCVRPGLLARRQDIRLVRRRRHPPLPPPAAGPLSAAAAAAAGCWPAAVGWRRLQLVKRGCPRLPPHAGARRTTRRRVRRGSTPALTCPSPAPTAPASGHTRNTWWVLGLGLGRAAAGVGGGGLLGRRQAPAAAHQLSTWRRPSRRASSPARRRRPRAWCLAPT